MSVNSEDYVHSYVNKMAPLSERQYPVFVHAGKGLRGDNGKVVLDDDGLNSSLQGRYFNQMTEEESTLWTLPIMDIVPKMHYEVWKGVRESEGVNMWGFYMKLSCDISIDGESYTFWEMETPFVYTEPFNGSRVPADTKIDSDEE